MLSPKDIDVVILCGGLGSRLRRLVSDRPKVMADINQQPFLDILIEYVHSLGFRRFILCIGYMSDKIKGHYANRDDIKITFSQEKELLGTGGALKKTRDCIKSDLFMVMNGDSFCRVDLRDFISFHKSRSAFVSIVITKSRNKKDCGCVQLDKKSRKIINFGEKTPEKGNKFISAGIYLFNRQVFSIMPKADKFSLEYDLFPRLVGSRFFGYVTGNRLIDIGTLKGLKQARAYFKRMK